MYKTVVGISLGAAFAGCLTISATAQLLAHKDLSTDIAFNMAEAAVQTCKQQGYNADATLHRSTLAGAPLHYSVYLTVLHA